MKCIIAPKDSRSNTNRTTRKIPSTPARETSNAATDFRGSELVPVLLEQNGKDELRFAPSCAACGEVVMDISEANVAVVGGTAARPKPAGTYKGARMFRLDGSAHVFCWECDSKTRENLPWVNAAIVFRNHDDPSQQRLEPTFRSVTR